MLSDGNTYVHSTPTRTSISARKQAKASFDFLVTLSGPCVNSKGKIG